MLIRHSLLLLLIFFVENIESQVLDSKPITKIVYDYDYRLFKETDTLFKENMILKVGDNRSSFMPLSQSKLDSMYFLTKSRYPTIELESAWMLDMQKSKNPYRIYFKDSEVTYRRTLNPSLAIEYKEKIRFDWILLSGSKEVLGYTCNRASLKYSGREWIAWYSPEIPTNSGPYIFKDLPGTILLLHDTHRNFIFEAKSLEIDEYTDYDPLTPIKNYEIIERLDKEVFWKQVVAFDKLSLKERLSFGASGDIKFLYPNRDVRRTTNQRPVEERIYIQQ